jgi:predicted nucleotidyltransferase component of viral defense system
MIISKETLIFEANRTGFRAEILEKVIRLIDLLNALAQDDFLKSRIVLKEGTALNLFYFDLKRLSVDIDLNYMGSIDRNVMLSEKPMLLAAIEKICNDKKYQSIRKPSEHAGGKWVIQYKSELIPQGQLEIDLNFVEASRCDVFISNDADLINKHGRHLNPDIKLIDIYGLINELDIISVEASSAKWSDAA